MSAGSTATDGCTPADQHTSIAAQRRLAYCSCIAPESVGGYYMRLVSAAVFGVIMLGGCAGLLTPSGTAATRWAALEKSRAAKAAGEQEDKICKNMSVMGSNFPQKVCSTAEEWEKFDEQQRAAADEIDRQRRTGNTVGNAFEQ
jgi:hypothetical protein